MPASPLAGLKAFAATRNGKLTLGGGALGTVVVAGLARRRRAKGDPTAPGAASSAPPYTVAPATGTSGANLDSFPSPNSPGIDVGQFEQLLSDVGRIADQADKGVAPKQAPGEIWYTVKPGDTLAGINQQLYGHTDTRGLQDANQAVLGGGLQAGTVLVVPKAGRLSS